MLVINAQNVNDALATGMMEIGYKAVPVESRVGMTLEIPYPVATVYDKPWERVLINDLRDANPFFHFMESLWILAGRADVEFLNEFNKRMADYSDDGNIFNAPYGYRLRHYFSDSGNCNLDQLEEIVNILKKDPNSRQAVAQIWDTQDINKTTKDKACNMSIVFRIRNGYLCMTVNNRSNDMIWGAYGANAVQFSMIQEYIAAKLEIPMGPYTQLSNSFHVYTEGPGGKIYKRLQDMKFDHNPYDYLNIKSKAISILNMSDFDSDLNLFFEVYDNEGLGFLPEIEFETSYFNHLVIPMIMSWLYYKQGDIQMQLAYEELDCIKNLDWGQACRMWIIKRAGK